MSQLLADWAVSWISAFITSLQLCEDVPDATLSTNSGYVCRDLSPRWQYLQWDFSDVLRWPTQTTGNFASKSFRWLWEVTACPGSPAGVPVSPEPLLLTRKDAWGHVGRKGGSRRSEVTAHGRRDTGEETRPNTVQHSRWQTTTKWTFWKLSSPCLNSWPHRSWNTWFCSDLKNQAEASQIKQRRAERKVESTEQLLYMKTEWDFLT